MAAAKRRLASLSSATQISVLTAPTTTASAPARSKCITERCGSSGGRNSREAHNRSVWTMLRIWASTAAPNRSTCVGFPASAGRPLSGDVAQIPVAAHGLGDVVQLGDHPKLLHRGGRQS